MGYRENEELFMVKLNNGETIVTNDIMEVVDMVSSRAVESVTKVRVLYVHKPKKPIMEFRNIPIEMRCPYHNTCTPGCSDRCPHAVPHSPISYPDGDMYNCSIGSTVCNAGNEGVTCKPVG